MSTQKMVSGVDIRQLSSVPWYYFPIKVFVWVSLIAVGIWLILRTKGLLSLGPIILTAAMYAHGVELQHQALHYTGFRSKIMNQLIGFFLGLPMFVSFSDYQFSHLRHHRLLGTPENKEFFNYGSSDMTLIRFLPSLMMLSHYLGIARYMALAIIGRPRPDTPSQIGIRIRNEYRLMAVILTGVVALSLWWATPIFIHVWLIPLLIATPIHALIELPEHVGCDISTTDVFQNTRSIRASKIATWYTNGNNYHVEHHWLPAVPVEQLHNLHERIASREQFLESSYWEFYTHFFKRLYQNGVQQRKGKKSA